MYGHGTLYRYSHGLKADANLQIVIPHGFTPGDVIWSKEIFAQLPISCFSDHVKFKYNSVAQKYNIKPTLFSSVHPFQSVLHEIDKLKTFANDNIMRAEDAIYFPLHSTKAIASSIHSSIKKAESRLEKIREKYKELNLCIYYIDYINLVKSAKWDSYRSKFNKVYCCGSRYEPAFLVNLAIILKEHRTLVTEGVGSHIFFGAMAKTKLNLLKHNGSNDCYGVKDLAQKSRTDQLARKNNSLAVEELHSTLDNCNEGKELIINRYINYFLSEKEINIEKEIVQSPRDQKCRGLLEDFDSKIYPLIE